jgi:hypothetical protein
MFLVREKHVLQQEQTIRQREDNARHFIANELPESSINMLVNALLILIIDSKH